MNSVQVCSLCQLCPAPGRIHKRCGGCQVLLYCGRICQKEHWKKVHKKHCKKIHCEEEFPEDDLGEEFKKVLKEDHRFNLKDVTTLQNPLKDSGDLLDGKLQEMMSHQFSSALNTKKINTDIVIRKIRVKYWVHVLIFGNSWKSTNLFLSEIFRNNDDIILLNKYVFSNVKDFHISFLFNLQLMLVATDYSIANMINIEAFKELEDEAFEAVKRRKSEASDFFSCWKKFSDQPDVLPLLLNKADSFLLKDNNLDTCRICKVPIALKTYSWACAEEKSADMVKTKMEDCSPFYRLMDGQGSLACCGKKVCNWEMFSMFQSSVTDLKLTLEVIKFRPKFVFHCDFCYRKGPVHRCSVCKSRWYCGAECQGEDWKVVHKEVCGSLKKKGRNKRFNSEKRKKVAGKVTEDNMKTFQNEMMEKIKIFVN
eukprot:GFUD01016829.1.p1 GENE.GFUD01016829.1~~GFUD01016829.1.p1  ORF type:complete len:424 (+),score=130.02 GFUD01016829.1:110-1381(+)